MDKKLALETTEQKLGFVPNLLKTMAEESPASVMVYVEGGGRLADSKLSAAEQQVAQLVTSIHNECRYCSSAHSVGGASAGISKTDIAALRSGALPNDERLASVAEATGMLLKKRGHLSAEDLNYLEKAGVTRAQIYDIVCHIGLKFITNWLAHIEDPEIDEQFRYEE